MHKLKKIKKLPILVQTETMDDFFIRDRKIAIFLDQKKKMMPHCIISFEDTNDLTNFLTKNK